MLEVKSLTKIYKGKKGADVHALDGVSLKFPETGMVFLLGKSGSGKSTLLNVCGGLDAPTSGEIIVKGRSSKSFSGSDFDSYRNTFVGFIFQEYNILNEFSVEDNIALALELQGKSKRKRKKEIRELLEQVDLKGYARRKPNTLSGGQKQRIAIARALVKSPEIIMADEPTGALDSNTGKQVFDTLKKLSETKLVIVVSHDREFAEIYADRIIELKDGKVISDITKTAIERKDISENVSEVDGVLCIKKGSELTAAELDVIDRFLRTATDDIIIAKNERDVNSFRKSSRIKDDGSREVFSDTGESSIPQKEYTAKESKFIRSKLPLRHAVRIGISGMKRKPIRLLLTIFLCTVAFITFGVLSTLSFYDNEAVFKETLPNSGATLLTSSKEQKVHVTVYEKGEALYEYDDYRATAFNNADIEGLKSKYGVDAFGGASIRWEINVKDLKSDYWTNEIVSMAYLPDGHSYRAKITSGSYPTANDEIVISSYIADMLVSTGFYGADGKPVDCASTADLIGRIINASGEYYKIVGIFDSGSIPEKYDALKSGDDPDSREKLYAELMNVLVDGTHLMIFTTQETIERHASHMNIDDAYYREISSAIYPPDGSAPVLPDWTNAVYSSVSKSNVLGRTYWINGAQPSLGDGEAILPFNLLCEQIRQNAELMAQLHPEKGETINEIITYVEWLNMGGKDWDETTGTVIRFTDAERKAAFESLTAALRKSEWKLDLGFTLRTMDGQTYSYGDDMPRFKVVGVYDDTGASSYAEVIFSNDTYASVWGEHRNKIDYYSETTSEYKTPDDAIYSVVYLPYNGTDGFTDMCWDIYGNKKFDADGTRITISSSFIDTLEMVDSIVDMLSKVFMWVGIILALFAALLFSNFISTSISNKRREIGILRAVGARGFDVFKIFFSESAVISAICILLSTVGSATICGLVNMELSKGIGVSLFVFGIPSFAVMVGIACLTALLATFLPVFNAARKKPVDSIRAL